MKSWETIDSAPRGGTHFWGKLGGLQARETWWGKASHISMHGWCYLEKPGDVESCSLWEPEQWQPRKTRKMPKNQRAYPK